MFYCKDSGFDCKINNNAIGTDIMFILKGD